MVFHSAQMLSIFVVVDRIKSFFKLYFAASWKSLGKEKKNKPNKLFDRSAAKIEKAFNRIVYPIN